MFLETFFKIFFLFILLKSNNNRFKLLASNSLVSNINIFFGESNISLIIETDSFDYQTFQRVWAPIILEIELKLQYVYFYVHKQNVFSPSQFILPKNQSFKYKKEKSPELKQLSALAWPRIVISDLPDNGYLPLMISSYTDDMSPLQFICYIDARNIDQSRKNYRKHIGDLIYDRPFIYRKNKLAEWIQKSYQIHLNDSSVGSVFGFKTKIHQKGQNDEIIEKVVGCDIVMVKEPILRELLYYTESSMDSPSPFLALSINNDQKVHNSYDNLLSDKFIQKVDFFPFSKQKNKSIQINPNKHIKCPSVFSKNKKNATFSVFVPCYKRNYFKLFFQQMKMQTLQPSYYVLVQNRFHVYLDYESEFKFYFTHSTARPIYKIWMLNYNTFFVLPNLVTSLLNTDFVIRFDDDHIPTSTHMLSRVVKDALLENRFGDVIKGNRISILNIYVGNFKRRNYFSIKCKGKLPDYVASPYIYRPIQMKLSGRLRSMFLAGGEDAHFGLSASILCNTKSKYVGFQIIDYSDDQNRHEIDNEIIQYKEKYVHVKGELIHSVYEYYVRIGLKPNCWSGFVLDPRDKINGSLYSHVQFY